MTEADDVIQALRPIMGASPGPLFADEPDREPPAASDPADDQRARIVALLGPVPVSVDDLVRLSNSPPSVVRVVLLELELAGRLERHGGSKVSMV